jgi:hypothetical protein
LSLESSSWAHTIQASPSARAEGTTPLFYLWGGEVQWGSEQENPHRPVAPAALVVSQRSPTLVRDREN